MHVMGTPQSSSVRIEMCVSRGVNDSHLSRLLMPTQNSIAFLAPKSHNPNLPA